MSTNVDPELQGDVDFDFFDSPRKPHRSEENISSDKTPTSSKIGKKNVRERQFEKSRSLPMDNKSNGKYLSSDEDSEYEKETRTKITEVSRKSNPSCHNKKELELVVPNCRNEIEKDDDSYSDSFTDDSDTDSSSDILSDQESENSSESDSDISTQNLEIVGRVSSGENVKSNIKDSTNQAWSNSQNGNRPLSNSGKMESPDFDDRPKSRRCRTYSSSSSVSSTSERREKSPYRDNKNSESESEMTDVSPLGSLPNSPKQSSGKRNNLNGSITDVTEFGISKGEKLDFNILIKALSELEEEKNGVKVHVKSNTYNNRRVMFAPDKAQQKKANYSFDCNRSHNIEKENRRLLQQIKHHVPPSKLRNYRPQSSSDRVLVRRPATSAINRDKLQQKIDQENLGIIKRLHAIKPTRGLTRDEQIKDYQKTLLKGGSLRPSRGMNGSPYQDDLLNYSLRPGSVSGIHLSGTLRSGASSRQSSRPTSAKSQLSTVSSRSTRSVRSVKARPDWSDRW